MKNLLLLSLVGLFALTSCGETEKKPEKEYNFNSVFHYYQLNAVTVYNKSGNFTLSNEQLVDFQQYLENFKYKKILETSEAHTGSIVLKLTMNDEYHHLVTNADGENLYAPGALFTYMDSANINKTVVFNTNGINFDEYK